MNLSEVMERYGETELEFAFYYKYRFAFVGPGSFEITAGGDGDHIYKSSILSRMTLRELSHEVEIQRIERGVNVLYDKQVSPLWAEYERQVAPLRAKYEEGGRT